MAGEFDLIRDYFRDATAQREDVLLGIGDDCALLEVPAGKQLAVSMDTLVVGRHFVADVAPSVFSVSVPQSTSATHSGKAPVAFR